MCTAVFLPNFRKIIDLLNIQNIKPAHIIKKHSVRKNTPFANPIMEARHKAFIGFGVKIWK